MKGKTKFGLIIGAIAVVAVLSISYVAAKNGRAVDTANGLETTLQVSRLSCGSCLATIEGELRKFDGMLGMRADLAQGLITVNHTEAFAPEKIAEAITGAGYPAKVAANIATQAPASGSSRGYGCGGSRGCGSGGCGLPVARPENG